MSQKRLIISCPFVALVAFVPFVPSVALATDRNWIDPNGGFFSDSGNWSGGSMPGTTDRAVFDLGDLYTVYFVANATNQRLLVADDVVTFSLGGRTYTVNSTTSTSLVVGGSLFAGDESHLTLLNGTLSSVSATIGTGRNGAGILTASAGATWNNSQLLNVGQTGTGTLNVINGADVTSAFATIGYERPGHAIVSGSGSNLITTAHLDVGGNDIGTLDIQSAGRVSTTTSAIGGAPAGNGTVTLTGNGSRWDQTGAFRVAEYGTAQLTLSTGSFVYNQSLTDDSMIADQYNSNGTVNVTGNSRWNVVNRDLLMGHLGNATLNINSTAGVSVFGGDGHIAHGGGTANVTVTDPASFLAVQSLYVGGNAASSGGVGSLTVSNGGLVQAGNSEQVKIWGPGTVHLNPGGRISTGMLTLAGGAFDWTGGQLWLNNQELRVGSGGLFGASLTIGAGKELSVYPSLKVGIGSNGTLAITGGGEVASADGYVGMDVNRTGTVNIDGVGSEWQVWQPLAVGFNGTGQITVTNGGGLVSYGDSSVPCGMIGDGVVSHGAVTIDGVDSHWNAYGDPAHPSEFNVGYEGVGTLNIRNGGAVMVNAAPASIGYLAAGDGTVNVEGAGSRWTVNTYELAVGYFGEGALNVTSGGSVDNAMAQTVLGAYPTAVGVAQIDGAGSSLIAGAIKVGDYGEGAMTIRNGGYAQAGTTAVANSMDSRGAAVVEGAGSRLSNLTSLGYLIVGGAGAGEMTVRDGGLSESLEVFIGDGMPAVGRLVVTGQGSTIDAEGEIDAGFFGNGTLEILDGGLATTTFGSVGYGVGSTGTAVVAGNGARWNMSDRLVVGGGVMGRLTVGAGGTARAANQVRINNTGEIDLTGGTIESSLVSIIAGKLVGGGLVSGNTSNAGRIEPGHSAGTIQIVGQYSQTNDGLLVAELGGAQPGTQYDQLLVTGAATLAGALEVRLLPSFVPPQNMTFVVLSAAAVTGTFDTINFVGLPTGLMLDVEYTGTSVVVRVVSSPEMCMTCMGDMNGDSHRDGQDIAQMVLCAINGVSAGQCPCGDMTSDGMVNAQDAMALATALVNAVGSECP